MEALISGRAGLALVVDGGQFASIHAAEPERMVPRQPAEFRYLAGEARDFVPFEDVTHEEIVRELVLAEDREDALQLILIVQDPDLPDDVRREALEELEELIRECDVGSYLENVLYAHPLPDALDLAGAMRRARTAEAWETLALLELLWTHQDAISEVRQAWESIPLTEFSGDDEHWQATAVRQGLFRDLARRLASGRDVNEYFVDVETRPEVRALPNHHGVLHSWLDILLRSNFVSAETSAERSVSILREPEGEYIAGPAAPPAEVAAWERTRHRRSRTISKSLYEAEKEARSKVNTWVAGAAAIGWVPGSMYLLSGVDAKLVNDIAKAFGVECYSTQELAAAVGASVTGKIVAGELLSLLPGWGWAVKSGVAAGVTKAAGEAIISYFKKRSPYRT